MPGKVFVNSSLSEDGKVIASGVVVAIYIAMPSSVIYNNSINQYEADLTLSLQILYSQTFDYHKNTETFVISDNGQKVMLKNPTLVIKADFNDNKDLILRREELKGYTLARNEINEVMPYAYVADEQRAAYVKTIHSSSHTLDGYLTDAGCFYELRVFFNSPERFALSDIIWNVYWESLQKDAR